MASAANQFWRTGKKIICVGRNYAAHAKELGNAVPSAPFFFLKPTSSFLPENPGGEPPAIVIPPGHEVHHEVEIGAVISKRAVRVRESDSLSHVLGLVVALDMTDRTLQEEAKAERRPWSMAKGLDTFCPVSKVLDTVPCSTPADIEALEVFCKVDGVERQRGTADGMVFPLARLISEISHSMTLEEGDLVLTGTPSGVGPVAPGQTITCGITDHHEMTFVVREREY